MNVPCSPTPAGPPRSATAALWCCLPPNGRRRLPRQILISGLNHTARTLAVYASQGGLLHRHARLASGWLANLSGRAGYPLGPNERFQIFSSSFPKLHLAHPNLIIKVGQTGLSKGLERHSGALVQELAHHPGLKPCGSPGQSNTIDSIDHDQLTIEICERLAVPKCREGGTPAESVPVFVGDDAALIEVVGRLRRRRIPQAPIALIPKREDGAL
jgi:hypothetical protein